MNHLLNGWSIHWMDLSVKAHYEHPCSCHAPDRTPTENSLLNTYFVAMELLHREVFSRDIPWNENTWLGKGMEKIWGWVCWFGSTGSAGHQPPIINFARLWLFQTTQCVCYISSWFKSMLRFLSWRWNVDVCVFPYIVCALVWRIRKYTRQLCCER